MSDLVNDAVNEMGFAGNYLVQYSAVTRWSEDEGNRDYMMREMLRFAEMVAYSASIIKADLEKRGELK